MIVLMLVLLGLVLNPGQPPIPPPQVPPSVTLPPLKPLPPPAAPTPRPPDPPTRHPPSPPVPSPALSCGCFRWDYPVLPNLALFELAVSADSSLDDSNEVRAAIEEPRHEVSCEALQLSTPGHYWVAVRAVALTGERSDYSNAVCVEVRSGQVFACDASFMRGDETCAEHRR